MRVIDWRHDGRKILLPVSVFRPGDPYDLTCVEASALLDTGATASGIGRAIIDQLDLVSYGKKRLKSAREESFVPYYLFRIGLRGEESGIFDTGNNALPYFFPEADGVSWAHDTDFQVILGMDVLKHCDFSSDRNGRCRLAFG